MSSIRRLSCALLCAVLSIAFTIRAHAEIPLEITYADAAGTGFFDPSPRSAVGGNNGTTLGEQRQNALLAALNHWSKMLDGTVPIKVQAVWVTQGIGTLASASPKAYSRNFVGAPYQNRFYPIALANQLAGQDLDPSSYDIQVNCNQDWDNGVSAGLGDNRKWYYGLDGKPPGPVPFNAATSDFDFYSIMLHEVGHGLGFLSLLQQDGTFANGNPDIFDNFLVNGSGSFVTSLSQSSRAALTTSANLFTFGSTLLGVNSGFGAPIHAPSTYQPGSSGSHLDESTYSGKGSIDELLTPVNSFTTHSIGPLALAVFRDLGYSFVDNLAPTVAFTTPTNGSVYNSSATITGTATDTSSTGTPGSVGLWKVNIALSRTTDGAWWVWTNSTWSSAAFNFGANVKIADSTVVPSSRGAVDWQMTLPALTDGSYEVQAMAVDQLNQGSGWVARYFSIDTVAPTTAFFPLQNGDTIFDFAGVAGVSSKPVTGCLYLIDITDGLLNARFWNGSTWITDVSDPSKNLAVTVTDTVWVPAVAMPSRAQIRAGSYRLIINVNDYAGNPANAGIDVTRSAQDTTLPDVAITSPTADLFITNNFLSSFTGTAWDAESGIATISLTLLKFVSGNYTYWNGSSWSVNPATVPATYNAFAGTWQSTGSLPSGGNLPNGSYQLQVSAQNRENPSGGRGVSASFTVDYHPVYVWTEGSYSDAISGNEDHRWDNAANWDHGVPPAEAVVVINGNCDASAAGYLNVYRLNLNGGSLKTVGMTVKFLNVAGGTFVGGTVQLDTDGRFVWSGGTLQPGTFNIPITGVLTISSGTAKGLYDATINNSGTIIWTGGNVYSQHGWFVNGPTGLFDAQADAGLGLYPGFGDGVRGVTNYGVFRKSAGTETLQQGSFQNYGQIDIQSGSFTVYDYMSLQDGSSITGNGKLRLINGCCGKATEVFGSVNIDGTVELADGNTRLRSATSASLHIGSTGTLRLNDGFLGGGLTLSGTGAVQWNGGVFEGTNTISSETTVTISGSPNKYLGSSSIVNNFGTFKWLGTGLIYNYGRSNYGESPAVFNNFAGAKFSALAAGTVFVEIGSISTFNNFAGATFIRDGDTNLTSFGNFALNNFGALQVVQGTLELNATMYFKPGAVLKGAGEIRQTGGRIYFAGTNIIDGATLNVAAGEFIGMSTNNATLQTTNNGAFEWSGGSINEVLTIAPNVKFNITGLASKYLGTAATLNNHGHATWTGTGDIWNYGRPNYGEAPAIWNNLTGSTFRAANDASFLYVGDASVFNNAVGALFEKTPRTNVTTMTWMFNNAGLVHAASGRIDFLGNGSDTGRYDADSGAVIRFGSGTHVFAGTTQLTGNGKFQLDGATLNALGSVTFNTNGQSTILEILSGTLQGSAAFGGAAVWNWTGGTIGGDMTIPIGTTLNITGDNTKTMGSSAVFNNHGTVNWSGPGVIFCDGRGNYGQSPCVFNNFGGATFRILTDGPVFLRYGDYSTFNNLSGALFVKTGGTNEATINNFIFNNAGEVRAETGTLAFIDFANFDSASLVSGLSLIRFAGDIKATNTLNVTGKVRLDGGLFTGFTNASASALQWNGPSTLEWRGGTLAGNVTISSNVLMNIFNPDGANVTKTLASAAVLNNEGTIDWAGPGQIFSDGRVPYGQLPSIINNRAGGRFHMLTDGAPFLRYGDYSTFNNASGALFEKTGGTNTTTINSFRLNNYGETGASVGTLEYNDATVLKNGGTLTGAGVHLFSGGTHLLQGTTTVSTATANFSGGYLNAMVNSNATIVTPSGGLFIWSGGTLVGDLTLAPNSSMNINGSATKTFESAAIFRNNGTVRWLGAGEIFSDGRSPYGYLPATIHNESGALFSVENDASFSQNAAGHVFNNKSGAIFRKKTATATTTINWNFNNSGLVELQSGLVWMPNQTFNASTAVAFRLGGTTAGSQYGGLNLSTTTLQGACTIVLTNGYTPVDGDQFTLASYSSHTGQFAPITLPALPFPLHWNVSYGTTALVLKVERAHLLTPPTALGNGQMQLSLNGPAAASAILETSTNMVDWKSVATNTPFNGDFNFLDANTANVTNKFYRIQIIP